MGGLFLLAALGGVLSSVQGPTNTALAKTTGRAFATFFSFCSGSLVLFILIQCLGSGDLTLVTTAEPWQVTGGLFRFIVIVSTIFATPRLGVALTTMSLMVGKIVSGVAIDLLGLFGLHQRTLTLELAMGIILLLVGITLISIDRKRANPQTNQTRSVSQIILPVILMFIAGCGNSIQAPVNASLSQAVGTLEATLVSFLGGLMCASVFLLISQLRACQSVSIQKPWTCLGGLYGVCICIVTIVVTPALGTTSLVSLQMLGQMTGGLIIDTFGFLDCMKLRITVMRALGIALIAIGSLFVAYL